METSDSKLFQNLLQTARVAKEIIRLQAQDTRLGSRFPTRVSEINDI
jgi:hypothetical protein